MRFGLHSIVAILIAILLLPGLALAQQPSSPPSNDASSQAAPSSELTQEGPIAPVLSGPYPVMSKAAEDRARQLFQMFNHVQTSEFWASLSAGLRKRSVSEAKYAEGTKKLRERMGSETKVIKEVIVPFALSPDTIYTRLSEFSGVKVPVITAITINQRGQVDSFSVGPEYPIAEGRFAGYTDATKLHLPFGTEWLVYQGGRRPFDNLYAGSDELRFAMDFVYTKDGRMFSGAGGYGSKPSDYYCFGQPILAPADGTVVKAEAGYNDNDPGKPSGDAPDGNVVEVSFGDGELVMMNHLKQNSLKVKIGDKVKQGDVLAQCGNSGASPAPHLHFELQKGGGVLVPAQFNDYISDGKPVVVGEPTKGEFVKNGNPATGASTTPAAKPAGDAKKNAASKPATDAKK